MPGEAPPPILCSLVSHSPTLVRKKERKEETAFRLHRQLIMRVLQHVRFIADHFREQEADAEVSLSHAFNHVGPSHTVGTNPHDTLEMFNSAGWRLDFCSSGDWSFVSNNICTAKPVHVEHDPEGAKSVRHFASTVHHGPITPTWPSLQQYQWRTSLSLNTSFLSR